MSRVAVVLAAGRGTRMGSERPKVLHSAAGRPLLEWVLDIAEAAGCERSIVVVGHGAEEVKETVDRPGLEWAVQREQRGTGHALAQVESLIEEPTTLLVLSGDAPLLTVRSARALLDSAETAWGAMAVADVDDPGSLGRVETDSAGDLLGCVEAADATPAELEIRTVNAGFYALPAPDVFDRLRRLRPDNAQGEIYLPDALLLAVAEGRRVRCVELEDAEEAWGVNNVEELERVAQTLRERRTASR